jgi:hypothetical protein
VQWAHLQHRLQQPAKDSVAVCDLLLLRCTQPCQPHAADVVGKVRLLRQQQQQQQRMWSARSNSCGSSSSSACVMSGCGSSWLTP